MIFTKADWKYSFFDDIQPFLNGEECRTEISEEVYDEFLGCVPPIMTPTGFCNSEPFCHNSAGMPMYNTFMRDRGCFYYLGIMTNRRAQGVTLNDYKAVQ